MRNIFITFLVSFLFVAPMLQAQEPEGDFLFFTGTVYRDEADRDWVWLSWQAPKLERLKDLRVAVFRKSGSFDDPGNYELQSVTDFQEDPRIVQMLLGRGEHLGGDAQELISDINSLFQDMTLGPGLSAGERVLTVMLGSLENEAEFGNLMLLARKHPALAMATGTAHAQRMESAVESFELRFFDEERGEAGAVLGRLELQAGAPRELPAPVNLVEVIETSPRGDLIAGFRWDEPDALKRLALLHFGYNVYRMNAENAEANGFNSTPPDQEKVKQLLDEEGSTFHRVNRLPVMPNAEPNANAPFVVDDNNRFDEGGVPFVDGSRYYYFVAARDILGRDGPLSDALEISLCDRVPPPVPRNVRVQRSRSVDPETDESRDRLKIIWTQNPDDPSDPTVAYYVYRWESMAEEGFRGRDPNQNLIAGPIPHIEGAARNMLYDDTIQPEEYGRNFLYTVRAVDAGSCGINYSGHSGPGQGHLQNWEGAGAPTGVVTIQCLHLEVKAGEPEDFTKSEDDPIQFEVEVTKAADAHEIVWAELRWIEGDDITFEDLETAASLGRHYFADASQLRVGVPVNPGKNKRFTVFVQVGNADQIVSNWASADHPGTSLPKTEGFRFRFNATQDLMMTSPSEGCRRHIPGGGQEAGDAFGVFPSLELDLPDDAVEYRVYRRVNGGPLVLWAQGESVEGTILPALQDDTVGAPSCAEICYLAQAINKHGLAGPLVELNCFYTSTRDPAAPQVSPANSNGDEQNPMVNLQWFGSPYTARNYEVEVSSENPLPVRLDDELGDNLLPPGTLHDLEIDGETRTLYVGRYHTAMIGRGIGSSDSPECRLTVDTPLNETRYYRVYAISECGGSAPSNLVSFAWNPGGDGPEVPWPSRPLPPVLDENPYPFVYAEFLGIHPAVEERDLQEGVGVLLGNFEYDSRSDSTLFKQFTFFDVRKNPEDFLELDRLNRDPLFPCMLYRMQVANGLFPQVSGDLIQVSPLMENVAHRVDEQNTYLLDPYILVLPEKDTDTPEIGYIYLRDTQPVIKGARYQYFLLQFDDRMEMKRVIRLNQVEVPE